MVWASDYPHIDAHRDPVKELREKIAPLPQQDQEWMIALINWALAGGPTGTRFGAETLRQLARRVDPARCARETTASRGAEIPSPIRDAISVLRFRYDMLKELEP